MQKGKSPMWTLITCLRLFILLIFIHHNGAQMLYKNYKLIRFHRESDIVRNYIDHLIKTTSEYIDLWNYPTQVNSSILLVCSPTLYVNLSTYFSKFNVTHEVIYSDLQRVVRLEKYENHLRRLSGLYRTGRARPYYRTFDEINHVLNQLGKFRSFVTVETLGHTYEGRPIKGVRISTDNSKPIIWIDAGIHAREWIAPAVALATIAKLLRPAGQSMLKDYQFYIVPVVNPDGYHFTHTKHRFWRKNRAPTKGEYCFGTDLNRNFPFKWGVGNGASPDACSNTYRGQNAGSELETQSLVKKLTQLRHKIVLYLSLHSFGQYILSPYGFSRYIFPNSYHDLISAGKKVQTAINELHGYVYQVGTSSELLYEASGATDDFVIGELNIRYAYTIELCDEGRYGFLLPPSYIGEVGRQLWTALKIFAKHLTQDEKQVVT